MEKKNLALFFKEVSFEEQKEIAKREILEILEKLCRQETRKELNDNTKMTDLGLYRRTYYHNYIPYYFCAIENSLWIELAEHFPGYFGFENKISIQENDTYGKFKQKILTVALRFWYYSRLENQSLPPSIKYSKKMHNILIEIIAQIGSIEAKQIKTSSSLKELKIDKKYAEISSEIKKYFGITITKNNFNNWTDFQEIENFVKSAFFQQFRNNFNEKIVSRDSILEEFYVCYPDLFSVSNQKKLFNAKEFSFNKSLFISQAEALYDIKISNFDADLCHSMEDIVDIIRLYACGIDDRKLRREELLSLEPINVDALRTWLQYQAKSLPEFPNYFFGNPYDIPHIELDTLKKGTPILNILKRKIECFWGVKFSPFITKGWHVNLFLGTYTQEFTHPDYVFRINTQIQKEIEERTKEFFAQEYQLGVNILSKYTSLKFLAKDMDILDKYTNVILEDYGVTLVSRKVLSDCTCLQDLYQLIFEKYQETSNILNKKFWTASVENRKILIKIKNLIINFNNKIDRKELSKYSSLKALGLYNETFLTQLQQNFGVTISEINWNKIDTIEDLVKVLLPKETLKFIEETISEDTISDIKDELQTPSNQTSKKRTSRSRKPKI